METTNNTAGAMAETQGQRPELDLVTLLHQENVALIRVHGRNGERDYRNMTRRVLVQLLGRMPTADEIDNVCNW